MDAPPAIASGDHARFPPPGVAMERRGDGCIVLKSTLAMGRAPRSTVHMLDAQAARHPDRPFIRQRSPGQGAWREASYREVSDASRNVAQWLINRGLGKGDAVAILSGASIEHVIFALGAQRAGVAAAALSVNYSLASKTHEKLAACVASIGAKYAFVAGESEFHPAMRALAQAGRTFIVSGEGVSAAPCIGFDAVIATPATAQCEERRDAIDGDTLARIVFTSGTSGLPKACAQTQGALMAAVAQIEALGFLDFPSDAPPQLLESMPFSHMLAGSYNFNNALRVGATINLDEGKADPRLFAATIANLREISPSYFVTAPIGFSMLADALEQDRDLRGTFFKQLSYMVYGGAMLAPSVRARLVAMGYQETGRRIPLITNYGSTETGPVTSAYWETPRTDIIGLPVPGVEIKLVPVDEKLEVRVRGPGVMPRNGYVGAPAANSAAFDEEGFFKTGDAATFAQPEDPCAGLVFDGRLGEQFKLASGTWVSAGAVRTALLEAAAPFLSEAVICGDSRSALGALAWLNEAAVRDRFPELESASAGEMIVSERLQAVLREGIASYNAVHPRQSQRIERCLLMSSPLAFDANEATDKGTVNRHATLERRASDVSRLFATATSDDVIAFDA